jgi:hypothetical protein
MALLAKNTTTVSSFNLLVTLFCRYLTSCLKTKICCVQFCGFIILILMMYHITFFLFAVVMLIFKVYQQVPDIAWVIYVTEYFFRTTCLFVFTKTCCIVLLVGSYLVIWYRGKMDSVCFVWIYLCTFTSLSTVIFIPTVFNVSVQFCAVLKTAWINS